MNVFENEIAKYERRIARIEQNPSPSMIKSNRLFYQAQLDENKELLQAWQQKKTFLAIAAPRMLLRCFGDYPVLPLVRIADRLSMGHAEASVDKVRGMGLPDWACDRTILFLPLAIMGGDLPKPKLVICRTGACEVINDTHRTLARLLDIPLYSIDVPFEDPHQQHLEYVTRQVEMLIPWVEEQLPGAKFDVSKLKELEEYGRRWMVALHGINELRKKVPCPDHPRDVFREPLYPEEFTNPETLVSYYEHYRDELQERADKGWSPVGEEKLRIVWAISGPYGSNIWDYLAERGVSVPYWHYGQAQRVYNKPVFDDEAEFGRKLTPLEEEARMMLYNSWAGDGERWIKDTIYACKEFKADGLVLFEQTGCMPVYGTGQLVVDRLAKEYDIPAWCIEGRQLLGRSERVESEFMAGLDAFINLCMERKKGR